MKRIKSYALAFALTLAPLLSHADEPAAATAAPAAAPAPAIAPPDCSRPDLSKAGKSMKPKDAEDLNKQAALYRSCIEAYSHDQITQAKQHNQASEEATAEFNQFAVEMNAKLAPAK